MKLERVHRVISPAPGELPYVSGFLGAEELSGAEIGITCSTLTGKLLV